MIHARRGKGLEEAEGGEETDVIDAGTHVQDRNGLHLDDRSKLRRRRIEPRAEAEKDEVVARHRTSACAKNPYLIESLSG